MSHLFGDKQKSEIGQPWVRVNGDQICKLPVSVQQNVGARYERVKIFCRGEPESEARAWPLKGNNHGLYAPHVFIQLL